MTKPSNGARRKIWRNGKMNITEALWILERAHTRDDALTGYTVQWSPGDFILSLDRSEYIEAWGVVRDHLRSAPTDPRGHAYHLYADLLRRHAQALRDHQEELRGRLFAG